MSRAGRVRRGSAPPSASGWVEPVGKGLLGGNS